MSTNNLASNESILANSRSEPRIFDTSSTTAIKYLTNEELIKLKKHNYFYDLGSINLCHELYLHTEEEQNIEANSIAVYEIEFEDYEKILQDEYVYRIYGVFDNVTLSIPIDGFSSLKTNNKGLAFLTRSGNLLFISLNEEFNLLNIDDANVPAHTEHYVKRVRNIIHNKILIF